MIDENKFNNFFSWVSAISIFLILAYYFSINDGNNSVRSYLFWGSIGGKITLSILILNYIFRFDSIKYFYSLKFTKFISGFVFSAVILYSNTKASALLNDIFHVSATNFSYSLTFTTTFYSIAYISNTLFIIASGLLILLCLFEASYYFENKKLNSNENIWVIVVLILFVIMTAAIQFREFSDNAIRYKAYQLALTMDFDKKNTCENIPDGFSVAYIGSGQQKVIVNTSNSSQESPVSFEDFLMNSSDKGEVNKDFIVQPCVNSFLQFKKMN